MKINCIGTRILLFFTTFILGFSAVDYLVLNEADQKSTFPPIAKLSQPLVRQDSINLPCREYFDRSSRNNSVREESGANLLLPKGIKSSEIPKSSDQKSKTQENIRKEFSKLEKEIQEIEKIMKDDQNQESGANHTLIYVENCTEYSESR